jgi:hypothetical protein
VRDGVTSAFELEVGTGDVAGWYTAREGGQIVNYGVSIGHIPARMKVLGDPGKGILPAGIGGSGLATDAQMAEMETILREGLAQGALAMGFGSSFGTRGWHGDVPRDGAPRWGVGGVAGSAAWVPSNTTADGAGIGRLGRDNGRDD